MALVKYTIILNCIDPNRRNCVKYVRARVKNLPFGLWTINDKKKIINSHKPKTGEVAIIKTGFIWGHVALITHKDGRNITICEANFKYGKITERCGTEKDLKILGYFDPKKQKGGAKCALCGHVIIAGK